MSLPSVATRVARATASIGKGASFAGMCEKFTRGHFGFPAQYGSARLAYLDSARDGTITVSTNAPAGVPVFWDILSGKNAPYDHVAISVGGGYCISTSAGPGGTVAKVKIADLTKRWGMKYRGWGTHYHGVRVYTAPPKGSTPPGNLTDSVKNALNRMGKSAIPSGGTIAGIREYQVAHGLVADGYWGSVTERYYKWVRAFQGYLNKISTVQRAFRSGKGIVVDGFHGKQTRDARRIGEKARGYNPPDEPSKRP